MGFRIGIDLSLAGGGGRVRPSSGVVLQSQTTDASGAVENPDPTGTGDVALGSQVTSAVAFWNPTGTGDVSFLAMLAASAGTVDNPDPVGTGAVALSAPTIAASGVATSTLFSADFTTQSAGGGSVSSYGLSFSRASSGYSVRIGTSSVATGGTIGNNDVPRFGRRLDAHNTALVIEESRTGLMVNNRAPDGGSWSAGSGDTNTFNVSSPLSPDGTTNADRIQVNSGGFSKHQLPSVATGQYTHSVWLIQGSVAASFQINFRYNGGVNQIAVGGVAPATWTRYELTVSHTGTALLVPVAEDGRDFSSSGGTTAGDRDAIVDFHQVEAGAFATDTILVGNSSVTRAGERLYHPTGSSLLASDGSLRMYARLRPKGSSSQYANDMRLWHVGANDHAEVVASTGAVKVTIGGTAYTTATTATWAANDLVEFWVAAGGGSNATVVKYRVNGGSVTTLSTGSPPTQAAITISGALDLLCGGTSNQFTSYVELIEFYPAGGAPTGF